MTKNKQKSDDLIRTNITISPSVAEKGKKLAKMERRSFSNYLMVLIERDAERVGVKKAA